VKIVSRSGQARGAMRQIESFSGGGNEDGACDGSASRNDLHIGGVHMACGNILGGRPGTASPSSGWYGNASSGYAQDVLVDIKAKMEALSKDSSTDFVERMQRLRAIHEEQTSRISAILSDEQRAKYQKDMERKAHDRNNGLPDGPPPFSGEQGGGPPPPQGN